MCSLHFLGMQPDSAVCGGRDRPDGLERNISFLMKFPFDDQGVSLALDAHVFDGSIGSGEYALIQRVRQRIAAHANLSIGQVHQERSLVIENNDLRRTSGNQDALQGEDVNSDIVSKVV